MNQGEKGEEIWLQSFVCARVETFAVFFLPFFPPSMEPFWGGTSWWEGGLKV